LWLIGIREKKGVVGAPARDGSEWLPTLRTYFDQGVMPKLSQENIEIDGLNVVALSWDPHDPPYVINKGKDGERVHAQVPWREGDSLRTADRKELLQILEPIALAPALDFVPTRRQYLLARLTDDGNGLQWSLWCSVRVRPRTLAPLVIPYDGTRCRLLLSEPVELVLYMHTNEGETPHRVTGIGEVTFSAPATVALLSNSLPAPSPLVDKPNLIRSEITFEAIGATERATLTVDWEPDPKPTGVWGYWRPKDS